MSNRIFISYKSDNYDFVKRLTASVKKQGYALWVDFENIRPGQDWGRAIHDGLQECDMMILVMSPAALRSRQVYAEWSYFRERQKPIIPIVIEPVEDIDYRLDTLQRIDFTATEEYDQRIEQMMQAVKAGGVVNGGIPSEKGSAAAPFAPNNLAETIRRVKPPYLHPKSEFVSAGYMVDNVQLDLWVSGLAVNKILACEQNLVNLLDRGGQVCVLYVNPDHDLTVMEASRYVGDDAENLRQRINGSQNSLRELARQFPDQMHIRRLRQRPSMGYFFLDPGLETGVMTASPYFYKIDQRKCEDPTCEPPFIYLERQWDGWWFNIFKLDFEELWKWGEPWS